MILYVLAVLFVSQYVGIETLPMALVSHLATPSAFVGNEETFQCLFLVIFRRFTLLNALVSSFLLLKFYKKSNEAGWL